jgi:hypothetical protein
MYIGGLVKLIFPSGFDVLAWINMIPMALPSAYDLGRDGFRS